MVPEATTIEMIAPPDLHRPERTPYWPAWLASRVAALKVVNQKDLQTLEYRDMPTLPPSSTLKAIERDEIARHLAELDALFKATPLDDDDAEDAMMVIITKLMLALPSKRENDIGAEARGEAFAAALEDLPTWSVLAAARRWYRADAGTDEKGEPFDYSWCPTSGDLRAIALREVWRMQGRAKMLRSLLDAVPLIEFSDEDRAQMLARFTELSCGIQARWSAATAGTGSRAE
jgi:hypothetical protein